MTTPSRSENIDATREAQLGVWRSGLVALSFLFFAGLVHGQSLWPHRGGGDLADSGESVAYSIEDNVFVTGAFATDAGDATFFGDSATTYTSTTTDSDFYVGKISQQGHLEWVAVAGSDGVDVSTAIAVDEAENAYVTGWFDGTLHFMNADGGETLSTLTTSHPEAFIAKIDVDGVWQWSKKIGSSTQSAGRGIAVWSGSDGINLYVCGSFSGTATFGALTDLDSSGYEVGFVAMLKANGNWKWARNLGASGSAPESVAWDIEVGAGTVSESTTRPYVYVAGHFVDGVDFGANSYSSNGGSKDAFFAKLQSNSDYMDNLTAERAQREVEYENLAWDRWWLDWERAWIGLEGNCDYGYYRCHFIGSWNNGCDHDWCIDWDWEYNSNYFVRYITLTIQINQLTQAINAVSNRISWIDGQLSIGPVTWTNSAIAGGSGDDIAYGVAIDTMTSPADAWITGDFQGTATFGSLDPSLWPMEAVGESDAFVARLSASAQFLWAKSAGVLPPEGDPSYTPLPTEARSIAVDNSGVGYVAGSIFGTTTFGELEPVETNADFVTQLEDQLLVAQERLAEITTEGATAYGRYVIYSTNYLLEVLEFDQPDPPSADPPAGTYLVSTSVTPSLVNEWVNSQINGANNLETMLGFISPPNSWPNLTDLSDYNTFNNELVEIEVVVDANEDATVNWQYVLANSYLILEELGLESDPLPIDQFYTKASAPGDLEAIRNLLPGSGIPAASNVATGGAWLDDDCTTNRELTGIRYEVTSGNGTGTFNWYYLDPGTATDLVVALDPADNPCNYIDFVTDYQNLALNYTKTEFINDTNQSDLANLLPTGGSYPADAAAWEALFTEWTDGTLETDNDELRSDVDAVQLAFNSDVSTATVTFYLDEYGDPDPTHFTYDASQSVTNPHQNQTYNLLSTDTTAQPDWVQSIAQEVYDCPLDGNPEPCTWELYSQYQAEQAALEQTIADLEAQIASISGGSQANQDAMVAKINGDGTWAKATAGGGPADDSALDVAIGTEGQIYVSGNFESVALLGGLLPVVARGGDGDQDGYVTRLDSFLFGNFKRWVIGREVRPPLAAIDPSSNAPYGAPIAVFNSAGDQVYDAFFFIDNEVPELRKLIAVAPGSYQIDWPWELYGEDVWSEELNCYLDVEGNCYDPTAGIAPAIHGPISATGINEWPPNPQIHIAGAPVDLNPPINLNPEEPPYVFHSLLYTHFSTTVQQNRFVATKPNSYSVVLYTQDNEPTDIKVVKTIPYYESPVFEDQVPAVIGKRITDPFHNDNADKNGFVVNAKARIDADIYDFDERTGPIIPVNTTDDDHGQLLATPDNPNPTPDNPNTVNGIPMYDDDLVVAWYDTDELGVAWPEKPTRYIPRWPSSVGTVSDFAFNLQDRTPTDFRDAYDFALDLKNGAMYWTDISSSDIKRTDNDGSRTSDTLTLLETFGLINPGDPYPSPTPANFDFDGINGAGASHTFIGNTANQELLIPQLPSGPDDPENWLLTFQAWTNGSAGQGDDDGELVNILVDAFDGGSSEITWSYDIHTDVSRILELLGYADPFLTATPPPVSFDVDQDITDFSSFLSVRINQVDLAALLPTGVLEPNWARLFADWSDGSPSNGEIDGSTEEGTLLMDIHGDGSASLTFVYYVDDNRQELDTEMEAQGGFNRTLMTYFSGPKVIVAGLNGPKGIDIDLKGDKIYWTDSAAGKIQRANLDGTMVEDLITTRLDEPTGLALDLTAENPNDRRMYWTDPDAQKIYSAYLTDTRHRLTSEVLALFELGMGTYDLDEIYLQPPNAPYGGLYSDNPPFGGAYSSSHAFLTANQTGLATLLNTIGWAFDGTPVGDMSGDFAVWTNGDAVADAELVNIQIAMHGNGSCELHFLLDQNGESSQEVVMIGQTDTYTLLAFFLDELEFQMNAVYGSGFSYSLAADAIQLAALIQLLPTGAGEPDWTTLLQAWTDGDPATGTLDDMIVYIHSNGSSDFVVTYFDAGGTLQQEMTTLNPGAPTAALMALFFGGPRVYDMDAVKGDGASYEFLSQNMNEIEDFLLPIAFSTTYAYRTHELDSPGFLGANFLAWTNGTFSDGELTHLSVHVAFDGSCSIEWRYDVEDGYELLETLIPGFEEIIGVGVAGPTRIALDLTASDPANRRMYWLDIAPDQKKIQRAYLDGREAAEDLVLDLISPSGLTVYDRRIYWSDNVTAQVYSSELLGTDVEEFSFAGPYNAPKAINITTYKPPGQSTLRDSVITDAGIDKIVVASQMGSEALGQPVLFPDIYPQMTLYFQNDPTQAGFNPNDEHADFFPSTTGTGQNAIFALRDDLLGNSEPYVLLKYRSLVDNEWTMKVYEVLRNGFGFDFQKFEGVAGNPFFAPYPVRLLGNCDGTTGSGDAYFEDYKFNTYAKSEGTIKARFYYPLQPGFYWDEDLYGPIKSGSCVAWFGGDLYNLNEIYPEDFSQGYAHERVTHGLTELVTLLPTGPEYPNWTSLLTTWTNRDLVEGVPEPDLDGELHNVIIEVFADGTGRITWQYWEVWPPLNENDDPSSLITPLNTVDQVQNILDFFLFNFGYEGLDEPNITPMEVTYNIRWPDVPPILTVGETLMFPKNGLPDIYNQAAVRVIYERPDGEPTDIPRSLVNLIDPMSPREVQLISPNLPELPTDLAVKNEEGKLVIVSNASGTKLVPFSLRSRLSFDPVSGKLAFAGYLDTTVAGEPILLVNVLSANERDLLKSLSTNTEYHKVIDDLYAKTRNPNDLDLGDGQTYYLGLEEDPEGNIVPQSLVGLPKALTAGAATGTGWVTLVFNDDSRLNPLPVSLFVFRVDCLEYAPNQFSPYIGEIKIIPSDNIFDEQLTLRHSGDFGGNPFDDLNNNGVQDPGEFGLFFEWFYKPDEAGVSPAPPQFDQNGDIIPGSGWRYFAQGLGLQEITIEGANLTTLSDNWFFVRYRGYPVCRNEDNFTQLAGDPSSTPTSPRAIIAEGWIKRVVRNLNAFEARVQEFHAAPTNTFASMIGQLGERYEGPIAMNNDPNNLNSMGLIEAYETVLRRGMSLSIDGTPPINYGPANNALLLVANRIAGFYSLLGNEAYADALDPTIGFDTEGIYGYQAPTLYAFENQLDSLLTEELALLRGRDDSASGVAASPVYNRLYWNFTSGDGEVAYVQAYNIQDQDFSGVVDETDARILFPQGHGDAWGHYLTSLGTFYKLLNHPYYSWEPRAEAVTVAGVSIQVDYEDERRFAEVAAQKARAGARIVNMTYRNEYVADPASQWQGYTDTNPDRAWGLSEWARRTGQGAYIDWIVANSILPVEDTENTGIAKIDRKTIKELDEIVSQFGSIQAELDKADAGINPLGLPDGVVPFDIDPTEIDSGKTHFDQIYDRANLALKNLLYVFDKANQLSNMLRRNQDAVDEFTANVYDQDYAFLSRLIEIFGYPFEGDIGPGGTYPLGYDGPDIYHFNYVDYERLTGERIGRIETFTVAMNNQDDMLSWLGDYYDHTALSTQFPQNPIDRWTSYISDINEVTFHRATDGIGLVIPDESWGDRRAPGLIQQKLTALIQSLARLEKAVDEYDRHIDSIISDTRDIQERYDLHVYSYDLRYNNATAITTLNTLINVSKSVRFVLRGIKTFTNEIAKALGAAPPTVVGLSNDVTSGIKAATWVGGATAAKIIGVIEDAFALAEDWMSFAIGEIQLYEGINLQYASDQYEISTMLRSLEGMIRAEAGKRMDVFLLRDTVFSNVAAYNAAVAQGNRVLNEMLVFRRNAAAATQDRRYRDMFFRVMRNDALQKYHAQFDLAAQFVYRAAAAYDYETNLLGSNEMAGREFMADIVRARHMGEVGGTLASFYPVAGRGGLTDPLARMYNNFQVLKPMMGFNNPQVETTRFSLREELFRIDPANPTGWQNRLSAHRVADLWQIPEYQRYCRPFAPMESGPQPAIVIPFATTVNSGVNFFGWPLGAGDSAYDPSHFATRVRSVGVWFDGYDQLNLSDTPRVYLVPVGMDILRSPDGNNFETRQWRVLDVKVPLPMPLTEVEVNEPDWIPINHSLSDELDGIRRFSAFRAYEDSGTFNPLETTVDSRLIGRSVWNTRWVLIIPGAYMLADADAALDEFIGGVDDILFFFETYAYSGNDKRDEDTSASNDTTASGQEE